jgi:hypothetical protein
MDELDDFMYNQTLECLSIIDPKTPEYYAIDGRTVIEYCSESMADIAASFSYGYSIETAYKLAGTILSRYQIVADLGLNQYEVSFQLYNSMLDIRRRDRNIHFNTWVNNWTRRCEENTFDMSTSDETMTDSDSMSSGGEDGLNDWYLDKLYL